MESEVCFGVITSDKEIKGSFKDSSTPWATTKQ